MSINLIKNVKGRSMYYHGLGGLTTTCHCCGKQVHLNYSEMKKAVENIEMSTKLQMEREMREFEEKKKGETNDKND